MLHHKIDKPVAEDAVAVEDDGWIHG
jgi:hypothetical protein